MKKEQKIIIFAADEYEDLELYYPKLRLEEAGKKVYVVGEKKKYIYKSKHGYEIKSDLSFQDVNVKNFDALIIPGGYAPDKIRMDRKALKIVQDFHKEKKLIAFICHAASVLVSANVLHDIKCTSYLAIKDDVINAGGKWVNKEVVIDKHFISSRTPDDLPAFTRAILNYL